MDEEGHGTGVLTNVTKVGSLLASLIAIWSQAPKFILTTVDCWNHEIGYYVALSIVYAFLVTPLLFMLGKRVLGNI